MSKIGETSDGYHTFNDLYEHRHTLFMLVCSQWGGWISKRHHDGSMFDGWFVAGVDTPLGAATYHLPLSWWDRYERCAHVRDFAPKWDGHTPADALDRLASLAGQSSTAHAEVT